MTKNYKILAKYVKDISSETPDVDTYLFVKDNISNYSLNIDIKSKILKEKIIQVETTLTYSDKSQNKKKSLFVMVYATVMRIDDNLRDKKTLSKVVLCDLQNEIYPDLEKLFLKMLHGSGYDGLEFSKKVDFEELYKNHQN
jgi:preprotein translocase subunit SecB